MKGGITRAKDHLMEKDNVVVSHTKTPKNVREITYEIEDEIEISTTSNDKGRTSGKKDQRICFIEIQLLQ